jgi:regulator of replication initiation timing
MRIELDDGKYVYEEVDGVQRILRYGELWQTITGDKFTGAMASEAVRLQEENKELRQKLAAAEAREAKLRADRDSENEKRQAAEQAFASCLVSLQATQASEAEVKAVAEPAGRRFTPDMWSFLPADTHQAMIEKEMK